jgi:hypothetical protein
MPICAMRKRTAARTLMQLTKLEREVITDSMLKIQSIQSSLNQIDETKLLDSEEIHSCLKSANNSFRTALRSGTSQKKSTKH